MVTELLKGVVPEVPQCLTENLDRRIALAVARTYRRLLVQFLSKVQSLFYARSFSLVLVIWSFLHFFKAMLKAKEQYRKAVLPQHRNPFCILVDTSSIRIAWLYPT